MDSCGVLHFPSFLLVGTDSTDLGDTYLYQHVKHVKHVYMALTAAAV